MALSFPEKKEKFMRGRSLSTLSKSRELLQFHKDCWESLKATIVPLEKASAADKQKNSKNRCQGTAFRDIGCVGCSIFLSVPIGDMQLYLVVQFNHKHRKWR